MKESELIDVVHILYGSSGASKTAFNLFFNGFKEGVKWFKNNQSEPDKTEQLKSKIAELGYSLSINFDNTTVVRHISDELTKIATLDI